MDNNDITEFIRELNDKAKTELEQMEKADNIVKLGLASVSESTGKKYYYLQEGDMIKYGDEIKYRGKWIYAIPSIGTKAPDPSYTSHRRYRRLMKE